MSRGVVIFGINNSRVEYGRLAIMASAFVKKNMPGTSTCLITDEATRLMYGDEIRKWFDDVMIVPSTSSDNLRTYRDTRYYEFKDDFKNLNRSSVYDLSPYDETIMIDCDYLVCNDTLSTVWGNTEEIMINKSAIGLMHNALAPEEQRLNPYGIKMYWATVMYFKKGAKAKQLFDLVEHIKENWEFYKLTYDFPGHLFRNDYAFSIAIHILNGFIEDNFVVDLPINSILTASDFDQFFGITSPTVLHFFANDMSETWKFYATRTSGLNVHCMNKPSLLNNSKEIMEVLSDH